MNNVAAFRFRVDVSEVAEHLGRTREEIEDKVVGGVETLSIAAHAYIVNLANTTFGSGNFKRQYYLGIGPYGKNAHGTSTKDPRIDQTVKNLRWIKISDGIWMVELDENAKWLEDGRKETFMGDWLLKPGAKGVKRAKDGSLYRVIPFKETEGGKTAAGASPVLADIVMQHAKSQRISLKKIETNPDSTPKLGILHKLDIRPGDAPGYAPGAIYSKPRTTEDSIATGQGGTPLPPHAGIFKLSGAVVAQNAYDKKTGELITNPQRAQKMIASKKAKVKKETVVFRVISSKHKHENRWMYPEVEGANFFQKAYEHAEQQWASIVQGIERSLSTE